MSNLTTTTTPPTPPSIPALQERFAPVAAAVRHAMALDISRDYDLSDLPRRDGRLIVSVKTCQMAQRLRLEIEGDTGDIDENTGDRVPKTTLEQAEAAHAVLKKALHERPTSGLIRLMAGLCAAAIPNAGRASPEWSDAVAALVTDPEPDDLGHVVIPSPAAVWRGVVMILRTARFCPSPAEFFAAAARAQDELTVAFSQIRKAYHGLADAHEVIEEWLNRPDADDIPA